MLMGPVFSVVERPLLDHIPAIPRVGELRSNDVRAEYSASSSQTKTSRQCLHIS
jgi:hypothetical protein